MSRVVLCIHKDIFWIVPAMQHETLCAENISVRYRRAGASLNTSHKPFTTWWGKLLPLQSPSHRLSSVIACLFYIFLLFLVVMKVIPGSINLVNWNSIGKLISVTWKCNFIPEHIKLCQFCCNHITRQPTLHKNKQTNKQIKNKTIFMLYCIYFFHLPTWAQTKMYDGTLIDSF